MYDFVAFVNGRDLDRDIPHISSAFSGISGRASRRLTSANAAQAEPDDRLEKGHNVAFSVDHLERDGKTNWDGVRSHEAKKIMKEKQALDDRVLFYHSSGKRYAGPSHASRNCKLPGVAGIAKITRTGFVDESAFDESHPYYDSKSKRESPTWYCTEVSFVERLPHFVSLKLLQVLAAMDERPPSVSSYLTTEHFNAIKGMALLNRGRLSVQPVSQEAFDAVELLGRNGGFDNIVPAKGRKKAAKRNADDDDGDEVASSSARSKPKRGKRAADEEPTDSAPRRRLNRSHK